MDDRQGVWLARVLSSWLVACCSPPTLMRVHSHRQTLVSELGAKILMRLITHGGAGARAH